VAARASLPDAGLSDRGRDETAVVGGPRPNGRKPARVFPVLSAEARQSIRFVCSDMWQPYLNVIAEQLKQAVHVLDRFHIMKKMNEAIDKVRRSEAARLERDGYEPVLKHSRWCLLKRPENRTEKQTVKLAELMQYNLQSVRSYLLREDFQRFWEYTSPGWAVKFLGEWCTRTMRSKIEPMKKVAISLREHRDLILNWFRAKGTVSAGFLPFGLGPPHNSRFIPSSI